MNTTGLYIGRFQPFHNGHKSIVDTMIQENDISVVLIGMSSDEIKNPFDYNTRLHFFTHTYSNCDTIFFYPLVDEDSDVQWIEHILSFDEISNTQNLKIYGWDIAQDSAIRVIQKHTDLFTNKHIEFIEISRKNIPISWSQIRDKINSSGISSIKNDIPREVYEYLGGE